MRLFGILLIFLVLVAGGGYVYLATQDWKGRQQINAAGLKHLLVLQGLPLEGEDLAPGDDGETPFQVPMAGGESTKTISKKLLESYFATNAPDAAPPPVAGRVSLLPPTKDAVPVTNQFAEVKRVLLLIRAELEKAAAPAQKIALVQGWLLLQAETMDERVRYQALISTRDANGAAKTPEQVAADADELVHQLDLRFYRVAPKLYPSDEAALAPAKWKELQKKVDDAAADPVAAAQLRPVSADEGDRRIRLTHLLVHLDRDEKWQKRVAAIVGLRRFVYAIATQATRFREMYGRVDTLVLAQDQATFQLHQDLLLTEARQNVDRARATAEERLKLEAQKTAADDAVSRRRTQLKELAAQLEKVRTEVDQLLVQQTGIEKQLYEIQREVGLTLEEVYRLEALLAEVERERYGQPPRSRP